MPKVKGLRIILKQLLNIPGLNSLIPRVEGHFHAETGASLTPVSCGYGTIMRLYNLQGIG